MKKGKFIWADLSTYHPASSIRFYENVFGWSFTNMNDYHLANNHGKATAGIFETPDFLKKIKMPHFWMSYFQVESTKETVALAKEMSAKIEVDTTDFYNGKIALIRDPQGAGFTVYDGNDLNFGITDNQGTFAATELHVSNLKEIIPFYSSLFDWELSADLHYTYTIANQKSQNNISIKKIDNVAKGKYEYWVTTILVNNLQATTQEIIKNGGSLISQESQRNMMSDNSGEAFFYVQEQI